MITTIYLVKHADELKENGIKNTNESAQVMNEKYIMFYGLVVMQEQKQLLNI